MANICMETAPAMKAIGRTICKMGKAAKLGSMVLVIVEIMSKAKSMEQVAMSGMMAQNMKENG